MTTQSLVIPDIEPLEQGSVPLLGESRSIGVIDNITTYERAAVCKRNLVARRIFIGDFFKPMKQSLDAAKRIVLDRERLVLTPIQEEENRIGALLVAYDDEQERHRQLAQKRAQEEAQLAEAQHYEAMGDAPAADAALNGQGLVQVDVPSAVPKVAGISYRENWSAEVVDFPALVKAVAEGKAPMAYLQPNTVALGQAARSLKQELNVIPGLRALMTKTAIGRR